MNSATASVTNPWIERPARIRSRISVDEMSTRRVGTRISGCDDSSALAAAAPPRTSTTIRASCAIRSESRQLATCDARSSPIRRKSDAPGAAAVSSASVSTVKDNPLRSSSSRLASKRASPPMVSPSISSRCSADACTVRDLNGGTDAGTNVTRSSESASSALLAARR